MSVKEQILPVFANRSEERNPAESQLLDRKIVKEYMLLIEHLSPRFIPHVAI